MHHDFQDGESQSTFEELCEMTGFSRRSLLQIVAAVILYMGVGATELFAGSHSIAAVFGGATPATFKAKLYKKVLLNGMDQYVQVPVDPDPAANPPYDGNGYFAVPHTTTQETNQPGYMQFNHAQTLNGLVSGRHYKVAIYMRTGSSPNYTYTWHTDTLWTQN